tara:strand:- start:2285 stop:3493 length:1209 start_codon:yes stop_codon:yes gene_type:complete
MKSLYGLPEKVIFCKKCVESNQRFMGSKQTQDQKNQKKQTVAFDNEGVCLSCRYFEKKEKIDWKEREKELVDILDKHRRKDGYYDVLVPGSGGKDSRFVSHILKHKYKMNPLTCTWAPHMYTDIGIKNFNSWINNGFDNILYTPNGAVHRTLTQLAFKNLLHPFQPFVMGQFYLAPKIAIEKKIKLIVYGDKYSEKGIGGDLYDEGKFSNQKIYTYKKNEDLFFGGVHRSEIKKYNVSDVDLLPYLPIEEKKLNEFNFEILTLPYFLNYNPQSNFYYAVENTNFEVNPEGRTDGTYTKYSSLDDKIDALHFYTWFIKTGRGRATEDAALEVRNKIITREEAISLVKQYDNEFPKRYFRDILNYLSMSEKEFFDVIDKFRSPHLWEKIKGEWHLKKAVWMQNK